MDLTSYHPHTWAEAIFLGLLLVSTWPLDKLLLGQCPLLIELVTTPFTAHMNRMGRQTFSMTGPV